MTPTFHGEVQLAGWSESHNGGCKVTFWLAESSDLDAFRAMTVRKGNTAGQRLACALVEIGDDEKPVPGGVPLNESSDHIFTAEKPKGGPLARLAGQWCQSPDFIAWLRGTTEQDEWMAARGDAESVPYPEIVAELIRRRCGVTSRAELDHNDLAARKFHTLLRDPFMAWQAGR